MAQDTTIYPKRKREEDGPKSNLKAKRQKLLNSRQNLPIWNRQKDVRAALRDKDVLVLSGETGSGKSTQVPQFLLSQCPNGSKIAVTQPRRVAAITLANRVAEEMGTPCGSSSPASKVGYSVRFDESTSPSTRIKFLTEGMLLQEMLRDGKLMQYGIVVVDEVHERSVNVDLILGFLKQLLQKRRGSLKVVVMSATADVDRISRFFAASEGAVLNGHGPSLNGHEHNGQGHSESEASWSGVSEDGDRDQQPSRRDLTVSICHVEGRQYPVKIDHLPQPSNDVTEAALHQIFQIHCKEPMPGDILVFMTGQETIQSLQKLAEEYAANLTRDFPAMLVLPLFAALPQAAQQRVFLPPPRNTRKVILSTNIAETSVTVPGVKFVVDSGKAKIKQFRNRLGLDSLLVKPISKSSADQRKGRAGREAPGSCYRLYTEAAYRELDKENTPEILRCDLSQAVLTMKARGIDDIVAFPLLTSPPREAMEKALLQLHRLGALQDDGKISAIGKHIVNLPLSPALGRVIVEAALPEMNCLLEVIDIVACLNVENIFLNVDTEEAREQAQVVRQQLLRRQGDHLTLLAAVQAYAAEASDRKRWADDHLISHRAMQTVMDVRKQLRAQCKALMPSATVGYEGFSASSEALAESVLKAFLRGFSTNVARLCPDGSYKTFVGNQTVAIHPSSVIFGRKVEAIMYNEFVFTNKAYARGVSAVQVKWLEDVLAR